MRKAEDIIISCEHDESYIPVSEVLRLIKLAQLETMEETCKVCAENAEVEIKFKSTGDYSGYKYYVVNKQSILNCIETLKKEIE